MGKSLVPYKSSNFYRISDTNLSFQIEPWFFISILESQTEQATLPLLPITHCPVFAGTELRPCQLNPPSVASFGILPELLLIHRRRPSQGVCPGNLRIWWKWHGFCSWHGGCVGLRTPALGCLRHFEQKVSKLNRSVWLLKKKLRKNK